jgi:hypothetical protein
MSFEISKASFELLDFYHDQLIELSPSAEVFCPLWKNFLTSNGWTEEEFEQRLTQEIFNKAN